MTFEPMLDCLADKGWCVMPHFLPGDCVAALAAEARRLLNAGAMQAAGVGRGENHHVNPELRGDRVHWLDAEGRGGAAKDYLALMDRLRCEVNAGLQLGLFEFEGHWAAYPPGSYYRKHLDRFRDDDRRTLTSIVYLNQDWTSAHGGALRLYTDGATHVDVLPSAGTLVTFLAGQFWHEVLPASRERLSITGWFKTRSRVP